jgi:hypothetical protein
MTAREVERGAALGEAHVEAAACAPSSARRSRANCTPSDRRSGTGRARPAHAPRARLGRRGAAVLDRNVGRCPRSTRMRSSPPIGRLFSRHRMNEIEHSGHGAGHVLPSADQVTIENRPWKAAPVIWAASSNEYLAGLLSAGPKATRRELQRLPRRYRDCRRSALTSASPRPAGHLHQLEPVADGADRADRDRGRDERSPAR